MRMYHENIVALGKELGYTGGELRDWVEQERYRQREESHLLRDEARESAKQAQDAAEREIRRFQQEREVLELRLRLRDSTSSD